MKKKTLNREGAKNAKKTLEKKVFMGSQKESCPSLATFASLRLKCSVFSLGAMG